MFTDSLSLSIYIYISTLWIIANTSQKLDSVEPAKKRPQVAASLKSFITHFFPAIEKVNSLDSRQECLNVIRSLCSTVPKGVRWREDRSWMMVENVQWPSGKQAMGEENLGEVILTGVVRGKGLKADRLVQIGDWGDFQIEKITAAPLKTKKVKGEAMAVDGEEPDALLAEPSEDRDTLDELAPEEIVMDEMADYAASLAPTERKGVLLDDHHYFSDEETRLPDNAPKRLPRGTSKYQAAWFIDDMSDDGSDLEDVDEEMTMGEETVETAMGPADGVFEDINMREPTEGGPSEYPQSEMFLDPSPEDEADQIAAYRASRKEEAKDDLEFPDEVELEPNVLARERLIKYRGLKSLRTSQWETEEDRIYEPNEWRRLLEIACYKNAKNRIMKEAAQGGVQPGTRVNIHLRGVPLSLQQKHDLAQHHLAMFSLLRHEHKRTAVNYSITLKSDLEAPLRSKTELVMQCGPRRFIINPLFSDAGNTSNDVHKFQRYLHPGRTAIASFIAPLTWGSVPALFFRRSITTNEVQLIGTGTSLPPSHHRVIAKRIVLTGAPYKIHKKVVTVRYMFFNAEDVAWFKALQLWTRRGRSGFIRDSLGTHGYYKAMFDGKINPQDAVAVSLYKRVWPRQARVWRGAFEEAAVEDVEVKDVEDVEVPELVKAVYPGRVFGP
jgi:pre-rRNA-processing protein TSR1